MNNKITLIGSRIKECRKEKKLSQDYIAECCGVDARQTIGKWENGASTPTIEQLYILCDLFDCDIGYLLGEYDGKTRTIDDVQKHISLSQEAIKKLLKWSNDSNSPVMACLDALLCEQRFVDICSRICIISWEDLALQTVKKKYKIHKLINKLKNISSPGYDLACYGIEKDIRVEIFFVDEIFKETLQKLVKKIQNNKNIMQGSENYRKHQYAMIEQQYPNVKFEED